VFPRLCLVLSPRRCARPPLETAALAIDGGVDMVQLRDKEATDAEFVALARPLARLCAERGVPLILNDRVHLVDLVGARGAHVGEDDLPPAEARRLLGPSMILGCTGLPADESGIDYLGIGPVYATTTKRSTKEPGGPALIAAVRTALPFFAIGGITAKNAPAVVAAGAQRLAVSAAICAAPDPRAAAAALLGLL
jgi:thiamine-phosphate pyrophosphorylase